MQKSDFGDGQGRAGTRKLCYEDRGSSSRDITSGEAVPGPRAPEPGPGPAPSAKRSCAHAPTVRCHDQGHDDTFDNILAKGSKLETRERLYTRLSK